MNKPVDNKITEFIEEHHVLTIASSNNNEPYCANCFYIYLEEENCLIFTSDKTTRHIKDTENQNLVAGSIVLETNVIGKIQGVQIQGIISEPTEDILKNAKAKYLKRFPVAILMKTTLWMVELSFIKFTDNRLGFGKKLIWDNKNGMNP